MSWLSLIDPIAGILGKVIPDKDLRDKLAHEIDSMAKSNAFELAKSQIEVNKIEAQNPKLFVSGWRPYIGWTCGAAFSWHYLIQPIIIFIAVMFGVTISVPEFDMTTLVSVLGGLLGLGGLRTFEKLKGLTK